MGIFPSSVIVTDYKLSSYSGLALVFDPCHKVRSCVAQRENSLETEIKIVPTEAEAHVWNHTEYPQWVLRSPESCYFPSPTHKTSHNFLHATKHITSDSCSMHHFHWEFPKLLHYVATFAAQWQTLISGLVASIAAFVGARYLYLQIQQIRQQERDRLDRHHKTARAMLPLVLSLIMEYTESVARSLAPLRSDADNATVPTTTIRSWKIPPIPKNETESLANVISSAPDDVAQIIAELLGEIQVLASRLRSVKFRGVSETRVHKGEIDLHIRGAAKVYARCELLFPYARRETDEVRSETTDAQIRSALFVFGFRDEDLRDILTQRANA